MKSINLPKNLPSSQTAQAIADVTEIWSEWRRRKVPLRIFLILCFNLLLAPAVQAATRNELTRTQSWALGLLMLATLALSIYLFAVMFQPERF